MEVVACRTCKINIVFIAAVAVLVPKYLLWPSTSVAQIYLWPNEQANANVEVVACRTCKINTVFTAAVVALASQIYLWPVPL